MPRGALVSPLRLATEIPSGHAITRGSENTRHLSYLPIVVSDKQYPCNMDYQAAALATLFLTDKDQKRTHAYCDVRLVQAAEHRAHDMANRAYFNHVDREGHTPNYWVAQMGCRLPYFYPAEGNSVESITLNQPTSLASWEALKKSPGHRPHVLGEHPFYEEQVAYGIGYAEGWGKMHVLITTHPCE